MAPRRPPCPSRPEIVKYFTSKAGGILAWRRPERGKHDGRPGCGAARQSLNFVAAIPTEDQMAKTRAELPKLKRPRTGVPWSFTIVAVAVVIAMMVLGTWGFSALP